MENFICHIELRNGEQCNYQNSHYELYTYTLVVKEPLKDGIVITHLFKVDDVISVILLKDIR